MKDKQRRRDICQSCNKYWARSMGAGPDGTCAEDGMWVLCLNCVKQWRYHVGSEEARGRFDVFCDVECQIQYEDSHPLIEPS
jgi:hypothetical protein